MRTKEQLGYIVSAFTRKTAGGANALAVVVQSSSTKPDVLEERIESWLVAFREEIVQMPEENIEMEATAVVSQLLERDMKLSDEIGSAWGEIVSTETLGENMRMPSFDRLEILARTLTVTTDGDGDGDGGERDDDDNNGDIGQRRLTGKDLKRKMLDMFDTYLSATSPERRALSARVYCQSAKGDFEKNVGRPGVLSSYADCRSLKQFLSLYPTAPYWILKE